jgi:hypothetical protein
VLAGAALPILPFALWLATIDPGLVGRRTVPSGRALSLDQALQGVAALVTGIPLVFLPWIAFVLFFAWRFPKKPPSPHTPSHAVAIRLASLTAIVTLGLMAALLLAAFATGGALFGVSGFAIHCLFQILSVRGARARRPYCAARGGAPFRAEACDHFVWPGSRHLSRQARKLLRGAREV